MTRFRNTDPDCGNKRTRRFCVSRFGYVYHAKAPGTPRKQEGLTTGGLIRERELHPGGMQEGSRWSFRGTRENDHRIAHEMPCIPEGCQNCVWVESADSHTEAEKVLASLRDALIRDFVPVVIHLMRRNDHRLPSTNPPGWGYRQSGGNRGNNDGPVQLHHSGWGERGEGNPGHRSGDFHTRLQPKEIHAQFFVGRSRDSSLDSAIALQP